MAHDHAHDHHGGWRFVAAATFQAVFVGIEVVCGMVFFPNPAIVADAGHNVSDVIFALMGGAVRRFTHGKSHWTEYHFERLVSIAMSLLTIGVIGGVVGYEAFKPLNTSPAGLSVTGALGIAGFIVNSLIARFMRHSSDRLAQVNAQHYISDAKAALFFLPPVAVATGIGTGIGLHWLARLAMVGGALLITAVTAWDNFHLARDIRRDLQKCNDISHQQGNRDASLPSQRSY